MFWNCSVLSGRLYVNEDTLLPIMFRGLHKLGSVFCGHKMCLNKIRNTFLCPGQKKIFPNKCFTGKRGNICVGNNVPSFARALRRSTHYSCYYSYQRFDKQMRRLAFDHTILTTSRLQSYLEKFSRNGFHKVQYQGKITFITETMTSELV